MAKSNEFTIIFDKFYQGYSPTAHLNSLTETGNTGHASAMGNVDILDPTSITQGPGLATLTAGTEAGAVTELISFIMDKAVSTNLTYAIGPTKLFSLSATAVTNASPFPHTITNATDGESCINMGGNLYYFYNKSSGADCGKYDLASTFDDDWGSTIPTGAAALQKAPHPCAAKEDIIAYGNGRYLGIYTGGSTTLAPTKLDFGIGNQVDDVIFFANQWHIVVNSSITGTNRSQGQIYLYDGSAVSTLLNDETAVGVQRIGFIYVLNGITYVAYQDLSSTGGFQIGYISGRKIEYLRSFTGSLPSYSQKTLYKNTILFISNALVYSCGAVIPDLPVQISQLADAGFSTVGAIACPFGTPLIASSQSTSYKLAKFSGYDVTCTWRSIIIPIVKGRIKGMIDEVIVLTNNLGSSARCDLQLEYNQDVGDSGTAKQITTASRRRHIFTGFGSNFEDFRVFLNWSNSSTTNPCSIREIQVYGHYVEC